MEEWDEEEQEAPSILTLYSQQSYKDDVYYFMSPKFLKICLCSNRALNRSISIKKMLYGFIITITLHFDSLYRISLIIQKRGAVNFKKWQKIARKPPKTPKMLSQSPGGTLHAQNWALRPLTSFLAYKLGSETASTSSRF